MHPDIKTKQRTSNASSDASSSDDASQNTTDTSTTSAFLIREQQLESKNNDLMTELATQRAAQELLRTQLTGFQKLQLEKDENDPNNMDTSQDEVPGTILPHSSDASAKNDNSDSNPMDHTPETLSTNSLPQQETFA